MFQFLTTDAGTTYTSLRLITVLNEATHNEFFLICSTSSVLENQSLLLFERVHVLYHAMISSLSYIRGQKVVIKRQKNLFGDYFRGNSSSENVIVVTTNARKRKQAQLIRDKAICHD